jgi:hypothetical protein
MTDASGKRDSHLIDTAAVLLIVTAAAYLASFLYDFGYLSYFGLPAAIADASLHGLLLFSFTGASVLSIGLWLINLAVYLPEKIERGVLVSFLANAAIVLIPLVLLSLAAPSWQYWLAVLGPAVLVTSVNLLGPLLFHSKEPTYAEKIAKAHQRGGLHFKEFGSRLGRANVNIPVRYWVGTITLFFAEGLASSIGVYDARTQVIFPVREGNDPCLVLRVRQEGLLCLAVDLRSHVATGRFEFINAAGVELRMRKIGPIGKYSAPDENSVSPAAAPKAEDRKVAAPATPQIDSPAQSTNAPVPADVPASSAAQR